MADFAATPALPGDPSIQFDDLIDKLVRQTEFTPDDMDQLLLHLARMRGALAPIMEFAEIALLEPEPFVISCYPVQLTRDHLRAAVIAYDGRKAADR